MCLYFEETFSWPIENFFILTTKNVFRMYFYCVVKFNLVFLKLDKAGQKQKQKRSQSPKISSGLWIGPGVLLLQTKLISKP